MTLSKFINDFLKRIVVILINHPLKIILCAALIFLVGLLLGIKAVNNLSLARFEVKNSESITVSNILKDVFHKEPVNLVVLVEAISKNITHPDIRKEAEKLIKKIEEVPNVKNIESYWDAPSRSYLVSTDKKKALILVSLSGEATDVRNQLSELTPSLTLSNPFIKTSVGGEDEIFRQVGEHSKDDFLRADAIAIPIIFLALLIIYRSFLSAILTIFISLFSIVCTIGSFMVLIQFTPVSTFALNLTMVLGLGISVDYCLLIIHRFREEFSHTLDVNTALKTTVEKAGRTIICSAIIVMISFSALLLFPFFFLRSFAYAGILVLFFGVLASVMVLPAIIVLLKHRVLSWRWWRLDKQHIISVCWRNIGITVIKNPKIIFFITVILLMVMGSPFLKIRYGAPDERILPPNASSRIVHEKIRKYFSGEVTDAIEIIAKPVKQNTSNYKTVENYAIKISRIKGVEQVDAATGSYISGRKTSNKTDWHQKLLTQNLYRIVIVPTQQQMNEGIFSLVESIKTVKFNGIIKTGGQPVIFYDYQKIILSYVPIVLICALGVVFLLLYLMFGSFIIPIKAVALNILSLSVTFGSLVWIFQEGHLSSLLHFTPTPTLETSIPILMFCIAFGLSMDYEVFILERIHEAYMNGQSNNQALLIGIEKTSGLINNAALTLSISFALLISSGIVFLKMIGIGMAIAIIVDAFIVRSLLLPSIMALMGDFNWWPLKRKT